MVIFYLYNGDIEVERDNLFMIYIKKDVYFYIYCIRYFEYVFCF